MSHPRQTVIVVAGPTAVGKTALAIQLAQHFGTEIISADSRQCYRELNIGVAKPSAAELQQVKHYFINSHGIQEEVNAGTFELYALEKTEDILKHNSVVVMVGGTGLYIKAFCEGMDEMPAVPLQLRNSIIAGYTSNGLQWLQDEVKNADPAFWAVAEQQNPQRLMRALQVVQATGKSITTFRKGNKVNRPFHIIKTALELPKEALHARIHQRVDMMMQAGLEAEVKSLRHLKHINALQTVGYRELFDYFDGHCTLEKAVDQIKTNTRQYAKRQITWFKKDSAIKWFNPEKYEHLVNYVEQQL
ncbi:tRNA (adenosine(37)-N6)-dimethylallyltransferase MiaA [Foetidibacter luteolus]|uniref:tRNA (adenosine(37)-N6)-dimethylallyltransferase MiaA n=1 Tax=Foetidibacter luteolus TaxID=2608880 RepID=UPI00129AA13A|nr:tRNA (adenosine(37)-N6)-dimethylallyltransferase MiaA [Foetidibacter luteolus]